MDEFTVYFYGLTFLVDPTPTSLLRFQDDTQTHHTR